MNKQTEHDCTESFVGQQSKGNASLVEMIELHDRNSGKSTKLRIVNKAAASTRVQNSEKLTKHCTRN